MVNIGPDGVEDNGDPLGFCTRCFRVRWLARVLDHDKAGNPQGVCRSCAREAA